MVVTGEVEGYCMGYVGRKKTLAFWTGYKEHAERLGKGADAASSLCHPVVV